MDWMLLETLGDEERRRIIADSRRRRFRRREVLFHAGDPADAVHLIASGSVAAYVTTPAGSTAIFAVLGPGEAVGELALVSPGARTATVIALEPTETYSLRRGQFDDLRLRHPGVDRLLIDLLARRVRRLNAELAEAYFVAAETRVVRRLLRLARPARPPDERRVIHLTQEDLAGLAGTSRATANRTLRGLERDGLIGLGRGRIEIVDLDGLARRAGTSPR